MPFEPKIECFESLQHDPGVEGTKRWPGMPEVRFENVFDKFVGPQNHAAEATTLPVNMLCRRVDDDVGAEFSRSL